MSISACSTESGGVHSTEFVSRIAGSPQFRNIVPPWLHRRDSREAIDDQEVIAALVIDQDFDRAIDAGRPATLGVVLDGRRSNAAQIVSGYLSQIAGGVGADLQPRTVPGGASSPTGSIPRSIMSGSPCLR